MTWFNNRELDEYEERMLAEGRCICCGTKLKGPMGVSRSPHRKTRAECADCYRLRTGRESKNYYSSGTQIAHKICKALGYSVRDYMSTDMGPEEE